MEIENIELEISFLAVQWLLFPYCAMAPNCWQAASRPQRGPAAAANTFLPASLSFLLKDDFFIKHDLFKQHSDKDKYKEKGKDNSQLTIEHPKSAKML